MTDAQDIFTSPAWLHANQDSCVRIGCSPNSAAYNETTGTLALLVQRSFKGNDFGLSQVGLDYVLSKHTMNDGKPVKSAVVVLVDGVKVVDCRPASEWRERLKNSDPYPGTRGGAYWWVVPPFDDGGIF